MPAFANAHALVIGIADYQHLRKLPQVKDASAVAALLADPNYCGYSPENVRVLLDAQATRDAIRRELASLAEKCDQGSTVFFYFSGHGGRMQTGPRAGEYLLPVETVYPSDEDLAGTAIASSELTEALNRVTARKAFVILDCCHAGGIGEPRHLVASALAPGLSASCYQALAAGRGRAVLAACRADEVAYVPSGAEYGLFTEHLLNGLRGGAASDDGLLRVFDLFGYTQRHVTDAHPGQHPYFKFEGDENLPIALYRGGVKGTIARVEGEFRFDAYISFADREPDSGYVWKTLVPRLKQEGLQIAVSIDSEDAGVDRVVGIERGITQAKRTVIVLSEAYLEDHLAEFQATMAITLGIEEGKYRLLPVKIAPVQTSRLALAIRQLVILDLAHPYQAERQWERLIDALRKPVPKRGN